MAGAGSGSAGQRAPAAQPAPPASPFRFHHVHLNTVNASGAIDFYTTHFKAERGKFGGSVPAVLAQGKWLLFNEVSRAPEWPVISPLYHIGWGAPDMKTAYDKLVSDGVKFETPLTDISKVLQSGSGRTFFAYVDGPDHAMIEINSANNDNFQHVHFLSDDPVSAGQWYMTHFGATGNRNASREARVYNGLQIYPFMGANLDGIQFFWYPRAFGEGSYPEAWKGRTGFASSRGRVIDHIALSVEGLDKAVAQLESEGVKVTQRPQTALNGLMRSAFVEGPDGTEIEIVERGQR
ncbi:MAG TPA: VOC family protein [Terriglobia bacterium]|nr:VOC family protein [Terriglobia bacterium]